jgi:hypothetical protein
MSASQSGVFNTQQFTDLGAPLVGGRLYTYVQGTTTQKTAYTDYAGTIPHTYTSDGLGGQYIALNTRGELPAPLYLAAGSYDLALKTAAGATVWTRRADPTDQATSIWATLLTSVGASLIGWIQSGVGAVLRTVQDKLRENVSVTDFTGADFSVCLQAAIDALPAGGGVIHCEMNTGTQVFSQNVTVNKKVKIFLGAAVYAIGTNRILITSSGVSLIGISKQDENNSATQFTYSGTTSAIKLQRTTTATYLGGAVLEDFEVTATGAAVTSGSATGIASYGTRYCDFRNIEVYNFTAGPGMYFTGNGAVVDGFGATNNIYNPALSTNAYGIKVDSLGGSASTHGSVYGGYAFGSVIGFDTSCESWRIYGTDMGGAPCTRISAGADDTVLVAPRYEAFSSAISVAAGVSRTQIIAPSFINTAAGTELTDNGTYTTVVTGGANTNSKLVGLQVGDITHALAYIYTQKGTTGSIAGTGGTATISTLSSGGHYLLSVQDAGGGTAWRGHYIVVSNGASLIVTTLDTANLTCTGSGAGVVLTNTNASAITLNWSLLRIAQ